MISIFAAVSVVVVAVADFGEGEVVVVEVAEEVADFAVEVVDEGMVEVEEVVVEVNLR